MKTPLYLSLTHLAAIVLATFSISAATAQTPVANQSVFDAETPAELIAQQMIANSRVRAPEAPLSSLPPVEPLPRTPYASGGTPVVGLHNRDGSRNDGSRRNNSRRNDDHLNNRHNDDRHRRRDGWSFSIGTLPQETVVTRPGRYYIDPSGRVVVIGDNNTVIVNQGSSYPYNGYPYAGYASYGYPYDYSYGYPYSYPSTTTYTFNGPATYEQNGYSGGYTQNYTHNGAYSNYSTTQNSSAWMNSPGTISSTTVTPYPYSHYPGSYYGYVPPATASTTIGRSPAHISVTRTRIGNR